MLVPHGDECFATILKSLHFKGGDGRPRLTQGEASSGPPLCGKLGILQQWLDAVQGLDVCPLVNEEHHPLLVGRIQAEARRGRDSSPQITYLWRA